MSFFFFFLLPSVYTVKVINFLYGSSRLDSQNNLFLYTILLTYPAAWKCGHRQVLYCHWLPPSLNSDKSAFVLFK